jgi:hypothetical protein
VSDVAGRATFMLLWQEEAVLREALFCDGRGSDSDQKQEDLHGLGGFLIALCGVDRNSGRAAAAATVDCVVLGARHKEIAKWLM